MNRTVGWERFKELPVYGRVLIVLFCAALLFETFGSLLASTSGGDSSTSSSFSTKATGMAAYSELLAKAGHPVGRERSSLAGAELTGDETLVIAAVSLDGDELEALADFLDLGGRLVLLGMASERAAQRLVDPAIAWSDGFAGPLARRLAFTPETHDVAEVAAGGSGALADAAGTLPILVNEAGDVLASVGRAGAGRVVLIADETPLQNRLLAEAGNAAFGLAVAGPTTRPVLFAEGGRSAGGWKALPGQWRTAIVVGLLATALAMWSAGRRFGPPEDEGRQLGPPRRVYVDAMAATLLKTREPEAALAPLRAAARERLRRHVALPPDADDEQLRRAAIEAGVPAADLGAVFGAVTDDEQAMALGRAMARLGGSRW